MPCNVDRYALVTYPIGTVIRYTAVPPTAFWLNSSIIGERRVRVEENLWNASGVDDDSRSFAHAWAERGLREGWFEVVS